MRRRRADGIGAWGVGGIHFAWRQFVVLIQGSKQEPFHPNGSLRQGHDATPHT